jgi:hypothetical protein
MPKDADGRQLSFKKRIFKNEAILPIKRSKRNRPEYLRHPVYYY